MIMRAAITALGQLFGGRLGLGARHLLHEERFGETALGARADLLGRRPAASISNSNAASAAFVRSWSSPSCVMFFAGE
jgi:hypothetical protein